MSGRYIDAEKFKRMYREQLNCVFLALQKSLEEAIDDVPTADVRPNVHGEWAKICWKAFRCSECKNISEYYTDFCPNCGAIMDGASRDRQAEEMLPEVEDENDL